MLSIIKSNSAFSFTGSFLLLSLSFVANICLARSLPVQSLGTYFLIISMGNIAAVVFQLGIPKAALSLAGRAMAHGNSGEVKSILRSSHMLFAGSLSILAIILTLLPNTFWRWIDQGQVSHPMIVVLISTGLIAYQNIAGDLLRGMGKIKSAVLATGVIHATLYAAIQGSILLSDQSVTLNEVLYIYITTQSLGGLVGMVLLGSRSRNLDGGGAWQPGGVKALLARALPLWVGNLTFIVQTQSDIWIVNTFLSHEDVAIYSNALRLALLVIFPLRAFEGAMSYRLVSAHAVGNTQELRRIARIVGFFIIVLSFPFFLLTMTIPAWLMSTFFGPAFESGGPTLMVLALGRFLGLAFTLNRLFLEICGYHKAVMNLSLATGAAHLCATAIFCLLFGAVGAAIGNTLVFLSERMLGAYLVRRRLGIWLFAGYNRTMLAALRRGSMSHL